MPRSAIVVSAALRSEASGVEPPAPNERAFKDRSLGGRVLVDDRRFERCAFKHAVLIYAGGPPPSLIDCTFTDVGFEFQGAAGRTLALLQAMAAPTSGFRDIFKATFPRLFGH